MSEQELQRLQEKVDRSEKVVSDLQRRLQELQGEATKAQSEKQNSDSKLFTARQRIHEFERDELYRVKFERADKQIQAFQEMAAKYRQSNASMREELTIAKKRIAELEQQISELVDG